MGGQTKNPYDLSRNPGGSSGGTGAAVAASLAAAGMGTDTCGSIRIPAAHNALVGLRGTMGLSSRRGIVPLAATQDSGGPLARSITDLAIMLDATVGEDPDDPITSGAGAHIPRTYLGSIGDRELGDARIGVLTPLFGDAPEDAEVAAIVREAIIALRDLGADTVEIPMPDLNEILMGTSVINGEFKFDLQDFLKPFPNAPVHSLAEIIAGGKFDPAVDGVLRRAEAVQARESAAHDEALTRREARPAADRHDDGRARHHGARLSDDSAQGRRHRSDAGWVELSAERDDRVAGAGDSRRFHDRRASRGTRTARDALQRTTPVESGLRLRTGDDSAASAALDTIASAAKFSAVR